MLRTRSARLAVTLLCFVLLTGGVGLRDQGSVRAASPSMPTIGAVGTGQAGTATTIQLPPRTTSPTGQARQAAEPDPHAGHTEPPVPDDPAAPRRVAPPTVEETHPSSGAGAATNAVAPTDLVTFQNSQVPGFGMASTTDEPSVSNNGSVIVYTGNWYAAVSTDWGASFTYLNPYSDFPAAAGGFCCDQVTVYDPGRNITIWELQYAEDGAGNNVQRIAVANGQSGVSGNSWHYWDITPQQAGYPSGYSADYPHLALSTNYLYLSTNVFNTSGAGVGTLVYRLPLTTLATGGTLSFNYYAPSLLGTITPVSGATTTMYFAAHVSASTLRVSAWPEGSSTITNTDVTHSAYVRGTEGSGSCLAPDNSNMCGRDDSRVKTGWVAGGMLGFMWEAAQGAGGLGTFPYPYVHVVRIAQATMTLIDEPAIWSSTNAWAFLSIAVNGVGALGGSLAFGGGSYYPGSAIVVRDDVSPQAWQITTTRLGTNGPGDNRWGDFLTARPASGNGATWVAGAFTLQGPCSATGGGPCANVESRFLWFGRSRDNPFSPQPSPSPSPSPSPMPSNSPSPSPSSSPAPSPTTPTFADVPTTYWAYTQVEQFASRGITTGCGTNDIGQRFYCPDRNVTRAEMAVFLDRATGHATPPTPSGQTFADVPPSYWAYAYIEQFASLGITTGCGTNDAGQRLYCPDRNVTRAEMAVFLDRAKGYANPAAPAGTTFFDVPPSYWAYVFIEQFASLGITTGCGTNDAGQRLYCPDRNVTRAEMAVFLIRAYP
jgi:hypothetical protein